MKKLTRFLSALLAVTMLLALVPFTALAASTALKGKTIIALGDSMTRFGTTASGATSSTGEKTYPYYLSTNDYLGVPVINAGVGGDTTKHVMARFKTDVLDKKPDVVIICIGMNDQANVISSDQPNVSLAMYRSNLDYFIKEIKNIGGEAVIVTPSPVNTNSGYYVAGAYGLDYGGKHMEAFCNAMREVAIENECTLVDINYECDFEDMNKFAQYGDGIHHSDYGRKQYAKYISEHMLAVYDNQNKATMTVKCVDEKGNTLKTVTHVGAAGAHIKLASPEIAGHVADEESIDTTFVNGATFTFTYSLEIHDVIESAKALIACDYGNEIIDLIRENLAIAKSLVEASSTDADKLIACSDNLKALIAAANGQPYVVSAGASYTAPAANRETNVDDGIRLTDGEKDTADGGTNRYSGWNGTNAVNIDVDLGEVKAVNSFSAYAASDGGWGIKKPAKLTVYISDNGTTWTEIASQTDLKTTLNLVKTKETWDTTVITAVSDEIVKTRYVRFSVTPNGNFTWLSEVEAALRIAPAENNIYVTGIDRKVTSGDCVIFTKGTLTPDAANYKWSANAICEWNETENAYIVKEVINTPGTNANDIPLLDGQILIAAHSDEETASCILNKKLVANLKVGQKLELSGIDAEAGTLDVLPYVSIVDYEGEPELENGKTFWVTHFASNSAEGAGSIFTEAYTGCAWWLHVAFKPVEGLDNVYEIVAKSDGASNGSATPLEIPEGGFVYAVNAGNNYVNLYNDEHDVDFTSKNASAALTAARGWKIGDKLKFSGLDLISQKVPTTTEYIDWYADGYVCTAKYSMYNDGNTEPDTREKTEVLVSHVNLYNWGTFEAMIITGDGKTVVDVINQKPQYWIVYTVEKIDGKYIATKFIKNSEECYTVTVPAGGFLFYLFSENSAYELADNGALLGYEFDLNSLDINSKLAIDTTKDPAMTIYVIAPEKTDPDPEIMLGDVNGDGVIDQFDYILVKRHYFETRLLTDDEMAAADVNGDEKIDQFDYILIKRHYFGTYVIG